MSDISKKIDSIEKLAKEINGQTQVTLDDFMSVVNELQAKIGT